MPSAVHVKLPRVEEHVSRILFKCDVALAHSPRVSALKKLEPYFCVQRKSGSYCVEVAVVVADVDADDVTVVVVVPVEVGEIVAVDVNVVVAVVASQSWNPPDWYLSTIEFSVLTTLWQSFVTKMNDVNAHSKVPSLPGANCRVARDITLAVLSHPRSAVSKSPIEFRVLQPSFTVSCSVEHTFSTSLSTFV